MQQALSPRSGCDSCRDQRCCTCAHHTYADLGPGKRGCLYQGVRAKTRQRSAPYVAGEAAAAQTPVVLTAIIITVPSCREADGSAGPLSEREREIVALLAGGATDAQIAERLFLSVNTVRSHLERIRDKTGARRRAELVRYAIQAGIDPAAPST